MELIQSLDQAVLVANIHPIKSKSIREWCKNEGAEWAYNDFIKKIKR